MKPPRSLWQSALSLALAAVLSTTSGWPFGTRQAWAAIAQSPEAEARWLGKHLKPIADDEWANIAGPKGSEKYEIVAGDTLYGISGRLFGDHRYWPKIWALNNGRITNPHLIRPGNQVAFLAGSGTTLPGLSIQGDGAAAAPVLARTGMPPRAALAEAGNADSEGPRSDEYRKLPRQAWEYSSLTPSPIDDVATMSRSPLKFGYTKGIDLEVFAATEPVEPLGEITGGRTLGEYLTIGDTVYIESDSEVQVGETYALTHDPMTIRSTKGERRGYAYLVNGKVKIIGVKDKLFIGRILNSFHFLSRGAYLIPPLPRVKAVPPIPGPSPIEGFLLIDKTYSTGTTAQHKQVFIDRGSDDGVQPGMVFRAYEHHDPATQKKVTDSDFIVAADIQVLQVSERFSTGIITRSLLPIEEGASVVLLTDVQDLLQKHSGRPEQGGDPSIDEEVKDLDETDVSGGIGKKEERELRQLEKLNEKPEEGTDPETAPSPVTEPTPGPDASDAPAAPDPLEENTPPETSTAPEASDAPTPSETAVPSPTGDALDDLAAPEAPATDPSAGDLLDAPESTAPAETASPATVTPSTPSTPSAPATPPPPPPPPEDEFGVGGDGPT